MNTPAQQTAIDSDHSTILTVAGPGSGKTTTTVARINRLVDSVVDPAHIVALTFTNNAARELERRLIGKIARGPDTTTTEFLKLGYCGTLHGFALKMLKAHGKGIGYGDRLAIIDEEAAIYLLTAKAQALGTKTKIDDLLKLKGAPRPARGERLTLDQTIISSYYSDLREAGIVDFDILLAEFHRMLTADMSIFPIFTHLFVDEVQDSANIDWRIYLALPIENKFYVGDPDQAIYSFRGGNVSQMIEMAGRKETQQVILEENFRSHAEICDAANTLIKHNTHRIHKETRSAKGAGGTVFKFDACATEGEEVGKVCRIIKVMLDGSDLVEPMNPPPEISVLCRTNHEAAAFRKTLVAMQVPINEPPKSEMPRDWSYARTFVELCAQPENDTLAFFFLIAREIIQKKTAPAVARSRAALVRNNARAEGMSINQKLLRLPPASTPAEVIARLTGAGISRESHHLIAQRMRELPADATTLDLALALSTQHRNAEPAEHSAKVTVSTIHGAKGLEWDVVFITGCEDEAMPGQRKDTDVEEERRLFYVAVTRARHTLYLFHCDSRTTSWGAVQPRMPSRFLKEMGL